MLPLQDESLPLFKLARYWSRESKGVLTETEVMNSLLSAFWRNELEALMPDGHADARSRLIGHLLNRTDQPGFIISDQPEIQNSFEAMLKDGEIWVGWRLILLRTDPCAPAFQKLAGAGIDDYSDDVKVGLYSLVVTKAEFQKWCVSSEVALPNFWGGKPPVRASLASTESKLKKWMTERLEKCLVPVQKGALWVEVSAKFPDVAWRAFNRVWLAVRPQSWARGGRPKKRIK